MDTLTFRNVGSDEGGVTIRLINLDDIGIGERDPDTCMNNGYVRGWNAAVSIIESAPTIDVEPLQHGKWIEDTEFYDPNFVWVKCSCCGYTTTFRWKDKYKYCPNCGAKMK